MEPELPRVRPDHDGRGLRGRGPRPLLRPGRRAARRRRQPFDAGGRRVGDGGAFPSRVGADQGRSGLPLPRGGRCRPGPLRPGPVRRLPRHRRRRGGLDDRDLRGAPARDRELALGRSALLHPHRQAARGHADRASSRLQARAEAGVPPPSRPIRAEPARRQARSVTRDQARPRRSPGGSHWSRCDRARHGVRRRGRRGSRRRTKCCSMRRWSATARGSPARTASKNSGGSCSRCSTIRRRSIRTLRAPGGPQEGDALVAGHGRWHEPWIAS